MNEVNSLCRRRALACALVLAIVALWHVMAGLSWAQTPEPTPAQGPTPAAPLELGAPNPLAEQWVTEQVLAGKPADLATHFPSESDRVLSAEFLANLVTRPLTDSVAARFGVRIASAVITHTLDLHNAMIPHETWLLRCRFEGDIDLSQSHWANNLDLSGSRFKRFGFGAGRVDASLGLVGSIFDDMADFSYLSVSRDLIARNVQFVNPDQSVMFGLMQTGASATFTGALFRSPIGFVDAQIGGDLVFDQARFTNTRTGANFSNLKVRKSVYLFQAELDGPVSFAGAQVGDGFFANQARFTDATAGANFALMKVDGYAFFRGVVFHGRADFSVTEFGHDFAVADTQFRSVDQPADFNSMKVAGHASVSRAIFSGPVDFVYASIGLDLNAESAQFTDVQQGPTFSEMKVGGYAFFNHALFAGPATFTRMSVRTDLAFIETRFVHPTASIAFSAAQVGGYMSLSGSTFAGSADFSGLETTLGMQADGVTFSNPDGKASFGGLKTPGYVMLIDSVFTTTADFTGSRIEGDVLANGVRFNHGGEGTSFVAMRVGGNVLLHDTVFAGPVQFHHAVVGLNLELDGARFNAPDGPNNFANTRVGDIATFQNAVSAGPIDFLGGEVGGQLLLDGLQLKNADRASAFDGMSVDGTVFFRGATISSPVSMADVSFRDLNVQGQEGEPMVVPFLDLSRAVIKRELALENVSLPNGWMAPSLQVLGPTILRRLVVGTGVVLEQATLQTLTLTDVTWPPDPRLVRLDGLTYHNISAGSNPNSWPILLDWLNHAAYSANAYTTLEQYFRGRGYPDQADAIFIAEKRRERAEVLGGPQSPGWWWNLVLDWFVVYGRRPGRAFVWSMLVIIFGACLFRRRYMEPLKPEYAEHGFSSFWYSVDAFVPVLDLLAANRWAPAKEYWLLRNYLRAHAILGWLLIPIGLAALSGVIK